MGSIFLNGGMVLEITNFLSKDFLSSFVGSSIAIELIIYFTKELPLIKRIPTKLYAIIISFLHLVIINVCNNLIEFNVINIYCLIINSFLIAIVLTGGYDFILGNVNFNISGKGKKLNELIDDVEKDSSKEENSIISLKHQENTIDIKLNNEQETNSK
ncbi:MAG: hypothetical protein E7214_14585 [Clostridium sp.]|nr:hypothetical protein [Clostridium sp.]